MDRVGKTKKIYTCCNLALKPLLEFFNQIKRKRNEWPRIAACEDILQWLFGTWLDLSDLSTDREPKTRNSNIAYFRVSVLISLFSILRLSTFEQKELMSLENFCFVFTYNLLLWRSIVACNIVSSHKCFTYTNQTFCTMSFNRRLIKFFGGNILKQRGHVCFISAWTSRGF